MDDIKTAKKMMTIRVPEDLHREARLLSVQKKMSLNSLVCKWLRSWVDHETKEAK